MSAAQAAFNLGGPVGNLFVGFALGVLVGTRIGDEDEEECTPCASEEGGLQTGTLGTGGLEFSREPNIEKPSSNSGGLKNIDLNPPPVTKTVKKEPVVKKPVPSDPGLNVIASMVDGCLPCAEGWFYFQGSCYKLVIETETEPFWDGQADCARLGSKLAQHETKEEDDFIIQKIKEIGYEDEKFWFGLNKLEQHNSHPKPEPFVWGIVAPQDEDEKFWFGLNKLEQHNSHPKPEPFVWGIVAPQGTLDLHKNWAGPDPNNPPGNEYCGAMHKGKWIDLSCGSRIHYICELECTK